MLYLNGKVYILPLRIFKGERLLMNNGIGFIINKVKEYSNIPSLTHQEGKFLSYLDADIPTKFYTLDNHNPRYLFYKYNGKTRWLVLAHVDRISVPSFKFQIQNNKLVGQLDNVIAIAICRHLMEQHMPFDFMFTTQEETCQSADQIIEVWDRNSDYYVLDLDIDVAVKESEIDRGVISLRSRDNLAPYNNILVGKMRKLAEEHKVQYIKKNGDWLVCQIGTALEKKPSMKGMFVGLPIAQYHSNKEKVNILTIENMVKLFNVMREDANESVQRQRKNIACKPAVA